MHPILSTNYTNLAIEWMERIVKRKLLLLFKVFFVVWKKECGCTQRIQAAQLLLLRAFDQR